MKECRTIIIPPRRTLVFEEDGTLLLLEVRLKLSDSEYRLLRLISSCAPQPVTASYAGMSPAVMAATVCNINKKAARISGRRLIVCCRGQGYRLNEYP